MNAGGLRWGRGLLVLVSIVLGLAAVAVIAVYVVTGTDWGRERVRRFAQNALASVVHGKVQIGRLSGNLLLGMTVHEFAITDSAGQPFVAVESFTANYSVVPLFRKRIWIANATLFRPLVVLDHPPNGKWNWDRIFPRDTTRRPASTPPRWGDWIRFTDVRVVNGQLIVQTPWKPSARLSARARDSVIREALAGRSRLMIARANGGFQKIVRLDSVIGAFPLLRVAEPGMKSRLLEVSTMMMKAHPFRPPAATVRDVKGAFAFDNDSAWWKGVYVAMPASKATGDGVYSFDSSDLTLSVHGDPTSFADMRWVYPRLPANGRGKGDLKLKWRASGDDYLVRNADVTVGGAHGSGSLGITLTDTLAIHDMNVRFSGVDTRLVEQLIPHFSSPRRGVLSGRATVAGGRHALFVNGDVTFDDQRAGNNRLIAVGELGFPEHGGVRARDLRVQLLPAQVDMARMWMPKLPVGGIVIGSATINGSTLSRLAVSGRLEHFDRGTHSAVDGRATVQLAGVKRFDVDVNARPVSLVEVGRFFPTAGLQGAVTGPIRAAGTLSALRVQADLGLPESGRFTTRGTLDLASTDMGYDLTSSLYTVNLRTVNAKAPTTSLTGNAVVRGRGFEPATMRAAVAADLSTSRLDSIVVDSVSVRADIAGGMANIQRLFALSSHTKATVSGTLGLTSGRSGTLAYHVDVDSLGALSRWIPRLASDTGVVAPRPGLVARAVRDAKADSARVARATEMERMISGRPGPKLAVKAPRAVPADALSGTLMAAGTVSGTINDFDLRGRAGGDSIVARGNAVRRFKSEYAWIHARSPQAKLVVAVDADDVSAMGFAFDTVKVRATYASPGGHVELVVSQGSERQYGLVGNYDFNPNRKELRLAELKLRLDSALWTMARPAAIRWGGPGVQVDNLELRNRGAGRVYANGLLPTEGVADFHLEVDSLPVANLVDLAQTDVDVKGFFDLHGTMGGTLSAPAYSGTFGLSQATYNGTTVPELSGRFDYADRQIVTHFDALRRTGQPMMTVDGRIPINLALSGVTGSRLLPDPMAVNLVADSLPLELIPQFTDAVSNLHGRAAAKVAMHGTLKRPSLVGDLTLEKGTVTVTATGATLDNVAASLRMANDTVYVDSVAGSAKGPVHLRGSLAVGDWREPSLNLFLTSSGAELVNNDKGKLRVDAGVALTGPFRAGYLSGALVITQGVVYAPEPTGRHLVGAGDPQLFNVLDTAVAAQRDLFPPMSPLLANLRVEVTMAVKRNTWVRNREANIEIYTEDPITIHAEQQAFALTGVVNTDRGEYSFLGKRFQIKRGSATFIGSPDLNPTLQITGEYQVVAPSRTVNISVVIGGTVKRPRLSLESDAQPPRTQSELLSLLAFGQSTSSLLAFGSSSISGSAASGDLFGAGAQIAVQRLSSVALGVAVDQMEQQAGRAFGTDVLDITPGDIPLFKGTSPIGNFFTQTRIEAGKYVNPRTFVSVQEQAGQPGFSIEHRTADGWHFNASMLPRIILREPTLREQPTFTTRSYGGFIIREWRF
jgi:translocation and assembly module TamB